MSGFGFGAVAPQTSRWYLITGASRSKQLGFALGSRSELRLHDEPAKVALHQPATRTTKANSIEPHLGAAGNWPTAWQQSGEHDCWARCNAHAAGARRTHRAMRRWRTRCTQHWTTSDRPSKQPVQRGWLQGPLCPDSQAFGAEGAKPEAADATPRSVHVGRQPSSPSSFIAYSRGVSYPSP